MSPQDVEAKSAADTEAEAEAGAPLHAEEENPESTAEDGRDGPDAEADAPPHGVAPV